MNKILLEKDYQSIIIEAFKNPEIDWENYYVNIVNEHYEHNKDEFFERLTGIIDNWLTWYKSKVYSGKYVTAKYKDGITRTVDSNTVWYYDKNDTPIFIEPDKTEIPIPSSIIGNGYNISVNREFFNYHLEIIENIKQRVKLKNDLILLEQKLPDSIKKILAKRPMAQGVVSIKDLQARNEMIKELIKGQNIIANEVPKYLQELEDNITTPQEIRFKDFFRELSEAKINQIQEKYKNAENKEKAALIQYLVQESIVYID
ncbi:MAG: hypothetical protein PHE08_09865, partial [Bacteroidales bacterium]|nr:hypothetical protein [Bacteroidales bacterium]